MDQHHGGHWHPHTGQGSRSASRAALGRGKHIKCTPTVAYQFSSIGDSNMAFKVILICAALILVVAAAPTEQLNQAASEKEDLQTAASHWGGHWGGYGGHWGGWGGYYPYYSGYWSWPHYGHGFGYGWPYGYYGHYGYW
ncbi:unnamed protein product [Parnassius apollo]|uniref:(apollo) hypothetical protein n=1 Tax=Parnassius apollo TaxID=110799 RepID=A0A8S3Y1M6_PARAO|nr:unnamed protein product [Parnassius apollo]